MSKQTRKLLIPTTAKALKLYTCQKCNDGEKLKKFEKVVKAAKSIRSRDYIDLDKLEKLVSHSGHCDQDVFDLIAALGVARKAIEFARDFMVYDRRL